MIALRGICPKPSRHHKRKNGSVGELLCFLVYQLHSYPPEIGFAKASQLPLIVSSISIAQKLFFSSKYFFFLSFRTIL